MHGLISISFLGWIGVQSHMCYLIIGVQFIMNWGWYIISTPKASSMAHKQHKKSKSIRADLHYNERKETNYLMIWCSIRFLVELHKWLGDQTWGINGRCPPHFLRSYRSPFCSLESFICRWRSSMFAALKSCLPCFVFFFLVSTLGWMTGCYLWLCFSHHCFVLSSCLTLIFCWALLLLLHGDKK